MKTNYFFCLRQSLIYVFKYFTCVFSYKVVNLHTEIRTTNYEFDLGPIAQLVRAPDS